jgi:DinB superfamily
METPLTQPVPEDKDWTFVLDAPCTECGFVAEDIDVTELPSLVLAATTPWTGVLARADATVRPAPQVWSPLEYACHVRDVLRVFAGRVELIRTQDDPLFPNWDQDATAIEDRYWEQDPTVVADELRQAAGTIAAAWASVSPDEWGRPGTRSNGSRFTLDTLGRYFLHDIVHHLHDVGGR